MASKLSTIKPTTKSGVIRSNMAEIEAAIGRGCTYEQIAQALTEDTGLEITPSLLAVNLLRERNRAKKNQEGQR